MTNVPVFRRQQVFKRIGIICAGLNEINFPALKFLVLQLNTLQQTFEYEFVPFDDDDPLISTIAGGRELDQESIRKDIPGFIDRNDRFLSKEISTYDLKEQPPAYFILVTMARFTDEYYSMRQGRLSILALGNWKRSMAPPSILEFILTLTVRESVAAISPSLRGSIHLGTKGCLFDFTRDLEDVRFKVLLGFVCNHCRTRRS